MKKTANFSFRFFLLVIVSKIIFCSSPILALDQITNGSFTTNPTGWTTSSPIIESLPFTFFNRDAAVGSDTAGSFNARFQFAGGGANVIYSQDGTLSQTFPAVALASPVNAQIIFARNDGNNGDGDAFQNEIKLSGTIRSNSDPTVIVGTFLDYTRTGSADWSNPWVQDSASMYLPASDRYIIRFYWKISAEKSETASSSVDKVRCFFSPSGLIASETPATFFQLDWADSTGPATGASPLAGVNGYRIYQSPTSGGPWAQIATSSVSNYLDNQIPVASDMAFYAVTDVDQVGVESPLSPEVCIKRAIIQISQVTATSTIVSQGQSGIPVSVTFSNTGYSAFVLTGASLTFSLPGYSWSLTSPGIGTIIPGQSTSTAQFIVNVMATATSGLVTIDASFTGTNAASGLPISDSDADTTDSWTVQTPAQMIANQVSLQTTVYRGQTDVPILVQVENSGDASGYLDSATPSFTLGTYVNLRPVTAFPVTVPGRTQIPASYLVDIATASITGTSSIDVPQVVFRDSNILIQTVQSGEAANPGSWEIQRALNEVDNPIGIAHDSSGNVYCTDAKRHQVQKFSSSGVFITRWGSLGSGDGQFSSPEGIFVDVSGNVFVADTGNNRIQKFDLNGAFLAKWGSSGSGDGQFSRPGGIAVDAGGNFFVIDTGNNRIQKFNSGGSFLSKWGSNGSGNGQFNLPKGIALDSTGNAFVADSGNNRVQKFSSDGSFITKWGSSGSGDGQFDNPVGIVVDSSGIVCVMDKNNHRVQKFRLQ